jgi:hypothetical protein
MPLGYRARLFLARRPMSPLMTFLLFALGLVLPVAPAVLAFDQPVMLWFVMPITALAPLVVVARALRYKRAA